ncbi:hypothetical protein [Dokdonella ginsengisoli]|uniref:Uncharacterized protein n=1 Tax=Dokdonella ginsengisoli TaxID=363846 RepID=A0ABV9QRN9_9GAMM
MNRERAIERLRAVLEHEQYPRLGMLLIVALTGGCGFLASVVLLRSGVGSIALRYPLALCIAYAVFLLLLWLWLRTRAHEPFAAVDADDGDAPPPEGQRPRVDVDSSPLDVLGYLDDIGLPIVIGVLVLAALFASLWIVYAAPALLAELLFDAVLAAGLYRRLRRSEARHWLDTAVRRTFVPFVLMLAGLVAFGLGVRHGYPDAHSIGELLRSAAAGAAR